MEYYTLDLIYLLPSFVSSLQNEYANFLQSPYVNLFSSASTAEIITRNIPLYFKINNIDIYFLPFIFMFFYIFSLNKFLKSFYLNTKIFFIIILTILFSKIILYQNYHSFRLFLGLGYGLLVLSFYFRNLDEANHIFKTNFFLIFSIAFHTSLIIYILVFNLFLLLKYIKNKKFFCNLVILICLYASFYLSYKPDLSEILFSNIPGGSYLLSKISWFGVDYTGTNSHIIYYLVNPLVVGIIVFVINNIDYNQKKNDLDLFVICSLLIIILFINNTFIWKRMLYMFFPFYILLFYNYYNQALLKIKKLRFFSNIDLTFLLILNILSLQIFSNFLNLEINYLYYACLLLIIMSLKVVNYSMIIKNYNICLFLPFLNISYLSLISLSFIDLYK